MENVLLLVLSSMFVCVCSNPPDYRCLSDADCAKKDRGYLKFVCCTQISCNSHTNFTRFTSGCVKADHCGAEEKTDNFVGQFSARMPFGVWSSIQAELGKDQRNCTKLRQDAVAAVEEYKITKNYGKGVSRDDPNRPFDAIQHTTPLCGQLRTRQCERRNKFCCIKVTCTDAFRDVRAVDTCVHNGCKFDLKYEKIPEGLSKGLLKVNAYLTPQNFGDDVNEFYQTEFHEPHVSVEDTCSEFRSLAEWLRLESKKPKKSDSLDSLPPPQAATGFRIPIPLGNNDIRRS